MNKKLIKNKKNILREFDKEKYSLLLKNTNAYTTLKKCEEILNLNSKNYSYKRGLKVKNIIKRFILKYTKKSNVISEFGCGYGSIGLHLIKSKKFGEKKFIFLDISKNGILILKKIANNYKINKNRYQTGFVDIYNCIIDKKIKIPKNSVIFTASAMHYKKKHNRNFIDFFLKFNFRFVIFFEPIFEHNLTNKKVVNYIKKNNYSQNFLSILKKDDKIRIVYEKKNIYAFHKSLPYSLIIIEKAK